MTIIEMAGVELLVDPPEFPTVVASPPSSGVIVVPERGSPGAKGDKGDDGDSAYNVAVENGFVGTEVEWLASLEGPEGPEGPSAYEVAVANGFVGTEDDWLAELEGDVGPPGPASSYYDFNFAAPMYQWTVVHNLGTYAFQVETFDQTGTPIEGTLTYPDNNTVLVDWYYPTAGVARIIT